jgi:hypothetical protein
VPNAFVRLVLFLSSYAPLDLILAIRLYHEYRTASLVLLAIAVVSAAALFVCVRFSLKLSSHPLLAAEARSKDGDTMSYIVTYILPFLDAPSGDVSKALSLMILLAVIGILYVNSNMIYTNPLLNLVGYHVFEVETDTGKVSMLVTKRQYVARGSAMSVVSLGDYVVLEKP